MWLFITNFGDSSVMLPCAVLIALWLLAGLSARAALLWLLLFGAAGLSVALSEDRLLRLGPGHPPPGLHRLQRPLHAGWQRAAGPRLAAGQPGAAVAAAERSRPRRALCPAHRRLAGGAGLSLDLGSGDRPAHRLCRQRSLLWLLRGQEVNLRPRQAALGASLLLLPLLLLHGTNAPTQRVLERLAVKFADEQKPWTRAHQRAGVAPLQN